MGRTRGAGMATPMGATPRVSRVALEVSSLGGATPREFHQFDGPIRVRGSVRDRCIDPPHESGQRAPADRRSRGVYEGIKILQRGAVPQEGEPSSMPAHTKKPVTCPEALMA